MRESLREAYSSFYSVRDSKSASPTSGRIHKQRESFGPTVCLISKNAESEISDVSEDKMRILMLILEIERLNKVVGLLSQANRNINKSVSEESEVEFLRKQIISLKSGFERSENDKFGEIERQSKVIHSQNARLSEYEAQINQNNRNLREFENSQSELRDQIKYLETELQKTKIDASKIQRDSMLRSQTDIQKSLARERSSAEMELWKEKLSKYENLINEQKNYINDQKRIIDKLTNTELEIRQRYDYEVSMLKKGNQDMEQKIQQMERETSNRMLNTSAEASKELSHKQREMERLRERNEEFLREIEELKRNLDTVTKSKNESTEEMKRVITELRESLEELSIDYNSQVQRQEQLKSENGILKKEVQFLSCELEEMKRSLSNKIENLNEELENKENKISKMLKNKRGYDSLDNKLRRSSYSETNLKLGKNMKEPLLDLKEIIKDVVELQNSNFRIDRLIESNSRKAISVHHVHNYSNYGL